MLPLSSTPPTASQNLPMDLEKEWDCHGILSHPVSRSFSRACVETYTHFVSALRRVRHGDTYDIHRFADVDVRSNKGGMKVGGVCGCSPLISNVRRVR